MPICLVIVRPDVEILCLGPALHFYFLTLTLLLAEYGGVVHLAPLRFKLQTKQGLTALDEGALQGHVDVARLDVLENVILLPLEPDVHLVLEVECRLRVVVGSQVDFLTDAPVDGQLDALVEIKCGDGPVALGKPRILRLAVPQAEIEFGGTLRPDLDLIRPEDGLEDLRVDGELWRESAFLLIQLLLHLIPELTQVLIDVVFEKLIQGQMGRIPEIQRVPQPLPHHVLTGGLIVIHPVLDDIGKAEADPSRHLNGVGHIGVMGQRQFDFHRIHLLLRQGCRRHHKAQGGGCRKADTHCAELEIAEGHRVANGQ